MADPVDVITLSEAKDFLDINTSNEDGELATYITAASKLWVGRVGPVNSTAYDEWYDGGSTKVILRRWPVLTVSLVEESFGPTKYTLTDSDAGLGTWTYNVDKSTGLLTRRAMGIAVGFATGQRNIRVQYTAGYATIPADIKQAVALLMQHLWATQRGRIKSRGGLDDGPTNFRFQWPGQAEMIAASYAVPGIS